MIKPEDLPRDASYEEIMRAERVEADCSMVMLSFAIVASAAIMLPVILTAIYFWTR